MKNACKRKKNQRNQIAADSNDGLASSSLCAIKFASNADADTPNGRPMMDGQAISTATFATLASTSRLGKELFQPIVSERAREALKRAVALGNQQLAHRILDGNIDRAPALLLTTSEYNQASGCKLTGTVFQWALKHHDIAMCNMIDSHFTKIPDWKKKRNEQINEIFPEGVKSLLESQTPYDYTGLIQCIKDSSDDDVIAANLLEDRQTPLKTQLDAYRTQFHQLAETEAVFNPKHILAAIHAHTTEYNEWDNIRRQLFWRQVYGFALRYAPPSYMQRLCAGLSTVISNHYPNQVERTNITTNDMYVPEAEINVLEIDSDLESRLGFHYAIFSDTTSTAMWEIDKRWENGEGMFLKLCESNQRELTNLCEQRAARIKRKRTI